MSKKCTWRERLTCVHIWYQKITVWCWGVITTSCKSVHYTIISHPCNHLENFFLALSFTREFHKIWWNLSPLPEYWPFQIPIYEMKDFESWKNSKKKHGVSMVFHTNKIGETMPSHPFFIFCWEMFYIVFQWHWQVCNLHGLENIT